MISITALVAFVISAVFIYLHLNFTIMNKFDELEVLDWDAIEARKKLQELLDNQGDVEANHMEADEILCNLLSTLGDQYKKVVQLYRKVTNKR